MSSKRRRRLFDHRFQFPRRLENWGKQEGMKGMSVPFIDFSQQYHAIKDRIDVGLKRVFEKGNFILGEEEKVFETDFAKYCAAAYAVGVNSGTDALYLALAALDIGAGDEVGRP